MRKTRKIAGLALLIGIYLGGLGLESRAVAQDGNPGPPPMERTFQGRMHGRWWNDPKVAQQIGLTADQQKKMDDIMQQNRLKLIDLNASLQKQEAIMHPLMEADQPDEGKILAQIDAIAQARAELEKGNARMLFGIRQVLTAEQWKNLRELRAQGSRSWGRDGDRSGWSRRGPGGPPPDGNGPAPAPQMQ